VLQREPVDFLHDTVFLNDPPDLRVSRIVQDEFFPLLTLFVEWLPKFVNIENLTHETMGILDVDGLG